MSQADPHPAKSWPEIAAEARKETDPKKLWEIIEKLCDALEQIRLERAGKLPPKSAAA